MNIEKYLKPWVFALIGGFLIIGASTLSGIFEYYKQLKLEKTRNEISKISITIESAKTEYLFAVLKTDLALIQRTAEEIKALQKTSTIENKTSNSMLQVLLDYTHAWKINEGIVRLYMATGTTLTDERKLYLNNLPEKVRNGDKGALLELNKIFIEITKKYGPYLKSLMTEKRKKEIHAAEISKESILVRIISVIIQLLGLIILLFKEVPENFWLKKKNVQKLDSTPGDSVDDSSSTPG